MKKTKRIYGWKIEKNMILGILLMLERMHDQRIKIGVAYMSVLVL